MERQCDLSPGAQQTLEVDRRIGQAVAAWTRAALNQQFGDAHVACDRFVWAKRTGAQQPAIACEMELKIDATGEIPLHGAGIRFICEPTDEQGAIVLIRPE
jgi:hypothetical protein